MENLILSDPAIGALLGRGGADWSGEFVSEDTALTLSAIWRGSLTIANALADLPLKTYRTTPAGERERIGSFFDDPAAGVTGHPTAFEWKQTNFLHLALQGEAPMLHRYNEGGAIVGLEPVHPLALSIERAPADESGPGRTYPDGLIYKVTVHEGAGTRQQSLGSDKITVVRGPISRGLRGMSFLSFGRHSLGTSLAGEKAAAKAFKNGAQTAGVLVPGADENLSISDVETIKADLDQRLFGVDNAGGIPIVNKVLHFEPWAMTLADAQFIESRSFQLDEAARWIGVPPHLLYQLDKTSSWGSGIAQQNKNLAQFVLRGHSSPFEQRCSRLLAQPRFVEFDYYGLESGSAADEQALLLAAVNGGLRTPNEARRILNLEPIDGADVLRVPSGVMLQPQLDAAAAAAAVGVPTDAPPTEEPA